MSELTNLQFKISNQTNSRIELILDYLCGGLCLCLLLFLLLVLLFLLVVLLLVHAASYEHVDDALRQDEAIIVVVELVENVVDFFLGHLLAERHENMLEVVCVDGVRHNCLSLHDVGDCR